MMNKICKKCGIEKSVNDFDKNKSLKDGRQSWCKLCKNEHRKERRRAKQGCYKNEYQNYKEKHLEICARRHERQRQTVFSHYSPDLKCCKCGFDDVRALSIDHIHGGGTKHRKEINRLGTSFYRWLIVNNFPDEFQLLCMNCQFIKRHEENKYRQPIKENLEFKKVTTINGLNQIVFNRPDSK